MEPLSVKELAVKTREAMRAIGVTEYSLWRQYFDCLLTVVRWFEKRGHEMFSIEVANDFLSTLSGRLEREEISRGYYNFMRRGVEKMMDTYQYGSPTCRLPKVGSKYKFNSYYDELLREYTESESFHKNTLGDIVWVVSRFFSWLTENGYDDLSNVDADALQRFVIGCADTMKPNSVHNVKLYLKKLCAYLYRRGLLPNSYEKLLSFRVSREARQLPTTSQEELEAVLSIVDRDSPKGKRDYAMFMLAVVTGLRAIDIMRLKLTDINWYTGEINIVQSKTRQALQLPLTTDIAEALQDYILNGRQKTQTQEIFLRHCPPFRAFADSVAIGDIYDEYRKKAGFERTAFDGKGFHSLRRTVGTNLVTSDIALETAAQLLGKITPQSMKKYIALDIPHLKECALDFSDIDAEAAI